ncbi:MAG: magnesium transporter CorA family protein [Candidatus Saccharimonadales bacterium]
MVTYYYKSSRTAKLVISHEYRPGSWVSVESPTEEEITMLSNRFKLNLRHMNDVLDEDEIPRLEYEGDTTYLFVRYAYENESMELVTAPLLCVVRADLLMTISHSTFSRLQNFTTGKIEFSTVQPVELMLMILDQVADHYESHINNSTKRIKMFRSRFATHDMDNQDFIDFVVVEDGLNIFLAALQPTTAILSRLLLGRHIPLNENTRGAIKDLLLNTEQLIEECHGSIKTITTIRNVYATIASNNLNRTMKILTVATLLIAIPNAFFGMYGMNIGLPFQEEMWAYVFVIGLTLATTAIVIILARARKIF